MTRKVTITEEAKSDMSGQVATQVRTLSEGGRTATLDLTDREAATFDSFVTKYFAKAHDVQVADPVLREWAQSNGFPVGARGRLSSGIREAYFAAMGAGEDTDSE